MQHLRPCTACSRHVLAHDPICAFCGHSLDVDRTAPSPSGARLGRAARMALGAAVVTTASAVACGGSTTTLGNGDASADSGGDTGTGGDGSADGSADASTDGTADVTSFPDANDENIAKPYGAPPADGLSGLRKRTVV